MSQSSQQSEEYLCIGCHKLYSGGDVSHRLRNKQCVCVGCQSADEETHTPQSEFGSDDETRYSRFGL